MSIDYDEYFFTVETIHEDTNTLVSRKQVQLYARRLDDERRPLTPNAVRRDATVCQRQVPTRIEDGKWIFEKRTFKRPPIRAWRDGEGVFREEVR